MFKNIMDLGSTYSLIRRWTSNKGCFYSGRLWMNNIFTEQILSDFGFKKIPFHVFCPLKIFLEVFRRRIFFSEYSRCKTSYYFNWIFQNPTTSICTALFSGQNIYI